jgi:hypothetical protein
MSDISPDPQAAAAGNGKSEVVDDGQEEVFSRTAVEQGMVEDPKALGPEDLAKVPKSPDPSVR